LALKRIGMLDERVDTETLEIERKIRGLVPIGLVEEKEATLLIQRVNGISQLEADVRIWELAVGVFTHEGHVRNEDQAFLILLHRAATMLGAPGSSRAASSIL
jgi:hypothetical protein